MRQSHACFDVCMAFIITAIVFGVILNITRTSVFDDLVFIGATEKMNKSDKSFFDLQAVSNDGSTFKFSSLKNAKVTIIFNSGSDDVLARKNMKALTNLYKKYMNRGLEIVQFPSNDYNQESKNDLNIKSWMTTNKYGNWNLMSKTHVNGKNTNEVYKWLRTNSSLYNEKTGKASFLPWDYTKFIIDSKGNIIALIMPNHNLKSMEKHLIRQLSPNKRIFEQ